MAKKEIDVQFGFKLQPETDTEEIANRIRQLVANLHDRYGDGKKRIAIQTREED